MSCVHPLLAVYEGDREDLKKKVRILTAVSPETSSIDSAIVRYQKFGHRLMLLPCGRCEACRLKRRKEWSVRCQMEAQQYQDNSFVTLTYDSKHYPGKLVKSHYQAFIKAIRNAGYKIRYFGCGEYGAGGRAHFHFILFNYFPSDVKFFAKSKCGFDQYNSKELDKFWDNKGFVTVSQFSPECAGYVAGYVDKKLKVDDYFDDDAPEFICMSTKPGLGRRYVEEHAHDLFRTDSLVVKFGSHKLGLPRYFNKVLSDIGYDVEQLNYYRVKASTIAAVYDLREHGFETLEESFEYNKSIYKDKLERKKRHL